MKRKEELRELGKVFSEVRRTTQSSNSYTIILGDFNLTTEEINGLGLPFKSYQDDATTISYKNESYVSSFDHFCFAENDFDKLKTKITRVEAPEKYFKKDFKTYWKKISDHVPIRMDINAGGNFFDKSKETLQDLFSRVNSN